jgi:hypothetical protein
LKTCKKCGKSFPSSTEFFPARKGVLISPCKECVKAYKKEHYKRNKAEINRKNLENYYKLNPKEVLPNGMKRCTVCSEVKAVSEYGICSKNKDGLRGQCKACRHKEYLDNKEVRNRQTRENYMKNRESILAKQKADRERSVENNRQKNKRYYQKNRAKIIQKNKEYLYARIESDISFKILQRCRTRLYKAVKGYVKSERTKNLIGCSPDALIKHLEKQFKQGMTWGNYGEWHIDHIIPCAYFDFSKETDQKKCFHYSNLQPLWAEDNFAKHDKVENWR